MKDLGPLCSFLSIEVAYMMSSLHFVSAGISCLSISITPISYPEPRYQMMLRLTLPCSFVTSSYLTRFNRWRILLVTMSWQVLLSILLPPNRKLPILYILSANLFRILQHFTMWPFLGFSNIYVVLWQDHSSFHLCLLLSFVHIKMLTRPDAPWPVARPQYFACFLGRLSFLGIPRRT